MHIFESYDHFRKIIHIDMDAYYASVEQFDNPDLQGKPIAVGGGELRGVTTTASYEARKFGVKSAMPGWKAKQLCPDIIFVKPRFDRYKEISTQIRNIFYDYTDLVEPLSLDEAYLDVTLPKSQHRYATDIAIEIKQKIKTNIGLTASAGVSYCKFLAKLASDYRKPDGLTVVTPALADVFLETMPIEKFYGVGNVTAKKMNDLGIKNGSDLKNCERLFLENNFGKNGSFFYDIAHGIDDRPVVPNRERKSLAVENTFDQNIDDRPEIEAQLKIIAQKLVHAIAKYNYYGKTLSLKIKDKNFNVKTRSYSLKSEKFESLDQIMTIVALLLSQNEDLLQHVRLLGLAVSNASD